MNFSPGARGSLTSIVQVTLPSIGAVTSYLLTRDISDASSTMIIGTAMSQATFLFDTNRDVFGKVAKMAIANSTVGALSAIPLGHPLFIGGAMGLISSVAGTMLSPFLISIGRVLFKKELQSPSYDQ